MISIVLAWSCTLDIFKTVMLEVPDGVDVMGLVMGLMVDAWRKKTSTAKLAYTQDK